MGEDSSFVATKIKNNMVPESKASQGVVQEKLTHKTDATAPQTEIADQANGADQFANAGNGMDDDDDDEEDDEPAKVQTKQSVTDADNYKVFKYRLEHEPQNVANTL